MLTAKKILEQIERLTADLIKTGLCEAQNFPSLKQYSGNIEEIGITHADNSVFLKSIPYIEMLKRMYETKSFNIKMIDGALISLLYRFKNNLLVAHRLSFFPCPDLETFQSEPELYLDDEIYIDITDRRIVTIPIRFDFDNDEKVYKPIEHPISHLTLGQYANCRIPVTTALTPYQFISFIIMNFYHTAHLKYVGKFSVFRDFFEQTIFEKERELIHIHTPIYKK